MFTRFKIVVFCGSMTLFAPVVHAAEKAGEAPVCQVWGLEADQGSFNSLGELRSNPLRKDVTYAQLMGVKQPEVGTLGECLALAKSMLTRAARIVTGGRGQMDYVIVEEALARFQSSSDQSIATASMDSYGIVFRSVRNSALEQGGEDAGKLVDGAEKSVVDALTDLGATRKLLVKGHYRERGDRIVVRGSAVFSRD